MQTMEYHLLKKIIWTLFYPFSYLYYKLYVFFSYLSFSEYPVGHMQVMGFLLFLNIATFFLGIFDFSISLWMGLIPLFVIIIYSSRKIEKKIFARFSKETDDARIIGNVLVLTYIILSVLLSIYVLKTKK
jgi:hypothetical protein